MIVHLTNAKQGLEAMREVWPSILEQLQSGKKIMVEVKEWSRSHEQNKHIHAIINRIAREAMHLGAKWDVQSWKRLLVHEFGLEHPREGQNSRVIPDLSGNGIVQLGEQTSDFSIARASEFISWLEAWSTEKGIPIE